MITKQDLLLWKKQGIVILSGLLVSCSSATKEIASTSSNNARLAKEGEQALKDAKDTGEVGPAAEPFRESGTGQLSQNSQGLSSDSQKDSRGKGQGSLVDESNSKPSMDSNNRRLDSSRDKNEANFRGDRLYSRPHSITENRSGGTKRSERRKNGSSRGSTAQRVNDQKDRAEEKEPEVQKNLQKGDALMENFIDGTLIKILVIYLCFMGLVGHVAIGVLLRNHGAQKELEAWVKNWYKGNNKEDNE